MLVSDVSEDLLEDIFEGDQTGDGAKLIDNQSHVDVIGAELIDQLTDGFCFRNDQRLA